MNSLPDDLGPRLRNSLDHGAAPELSTDLVTGAPDRAAPKLTNPRARMQVAGGAIAIAAMITVGALVIAPGFAQAPLFTAASSSASGVDARDAAGASVPASGLMRIWAEYHYHAGPGLSTAGGNGHVYQLTRSGSGSKRAAALATVFGLSDAAAKPDNSDAANPMFIIGSTDGTTPSLELSWSGTGDWWFSDPAANPGFVCSSAGGVSSGTGGASTDSPGDVPPASGVEVSPPDCGDGQPTAPSKAPTGANARTQAQKIFASTGLDVSAGDIQLVSNTFQTTATANLVVGGVKTALDWGVSWSNTGAIASAYGHSVAVVDRGSHGTISAADAVDRLSDFRWSGAAGPKYQSGVRMYAADGIRNGATTSIGTAPAPSPVVSPPATEPTGAPTDTPTEKPTITPVPGPTDLPTAEPTAVPTAAPTPEPAPTGPPIIDVTITTAEPTLLIMWDSKGGAWLVPGYAMRVENGWWSAVVSLVPGVIELPPITTVEPDGVKPPVGSPGVTDGSTPKSP